MKKHHALLLFFLCLALLFVGLRIDRSYLLARGKADGFREGYLTGQSDRQNGQVFDAAQQHDAFPKNFLTTASSREARHYHAFQLTWYSGYLAGWQGDPTDTDLTKERWTP